MLTNSTKVMNYYAAVVDRLILQYKEYLFLNDQIKDLENDKFALLLKNKNSEKLRELDDKIALIKLDLDQVSNEMTFANPIIWMMYKFKAYKDTSNEIQTLGDFRKHCEPDGYICTVRYTFMCMYIKDKYSVDITNKVMFPDKLLLSTFYAADIIGKLLSDTSFLSQWKTNEYKITHNRVNKWNTNK